jgi:hypothetical protein
MTDVEMRDGLADRVAETVRRALAFVGPVESTGLEIVESDEIEIEEDQPVS